MPRYHRFIAILASLFLFTMPSPSVIAQDPGNIKTWHFLIEPYLMFPNMAGSTGIRNLPVIDVDADPGDIFSKLQMGAMLYLEARNEKWAITSDLLYMDLEQDATPSALINSGSVTAKQFGWEMSALYRLTPFLEAGIGGRLNYLKSGIDVLRNEVGGGTSSINESLSRTWYDPVLITRVATTIDDKWLLQFRGDFGGFGIGSEFTYQLQAYAGYRFSKLFHTSIGYRIISMDYDKGTGEDRFRYDMNIFGPIVKFGFSF